LLVIRRGTPTSSAEREFRRLSDDVPASCGRRRPEAGGQGFLTELNAAGSSLGSRLHAPIAQRACVRSRSAHLRAEEIGCALYAAAHVAGVLQAPHSADSERQHHVNAVASDAEGNVYGTGSAAYTQFPATTGA